MKYISRCFCFPVFVILNQCFFGLVRNNSFKQKTSNKVEQKKITSS